VPGAEKPDTYNVRLDAVQKVHDTIATRREETGLAEELDDFRAFKILKECPGFVLLFGKSRRVVHWNRGGVVPRNGLAFGHRREA
jgi:hypothetical protein